MAGTFFYNEADSSIFSAITRRKGIISSNYQKSVMERNAWCKIIGSVTDADGNSTDALVYDASAGGIFGTGRSFEATYTSQGTGKPKPSLISLEVTVEGSAGSLRRCNGKLLCHDLESFNKLENILLLPNTKIKVSYGYSHPEDTTDKSPILNFTVYDYSFTLNDANNIEVGFKAVGKGQEILEANALNTAWLKKIGTSDVPPFFVADYNYSNETRQCSSLMDALDYMVQLQVGALNTSGFEPKLNSCWTYDNRGGTQTDFVVMKAPSDYDAPGKQKVGVLTKDRITYYSLGFLCWVISTYICSEEYTDIICDGETTVGRSGGPFNWMAGTTKVPLSSGDPIMVAWITGDKTWDNYTDGGDDDDADNLRFDKIDKYSATSIADGDLSKILISRDCMSALMMKYREVDSEGKNISKIPIKKLLADIFATIEDASGGGIKLFLFSDPEDTTGKRMLVKNGNEPPAKKPKVVTFDPLPSDGKGDGVTVAIRLTGKVPKGHQAEAFGSTPGSGDSGTAIVALTEEEAAVPEQEEGLFARYEAAHNNLAYNDFDADSISGLKGTLKEIVGNETPEEAVKNKAMPYPLEMECLLHGIYGFKFGDTVSSKHLPKRYTKESGFRVGFTVTGVTDKIENNKWTTELKTTCRIVNN